MQLEFDKIDVKKSKAFESENFALGDVRVIMELLSSKIYSRPKYIIIQEVASNARDANREAGKGDEPITIKLPNALDDNLRITDFGPGITPERMSDVFLKYGNSTKRTDNIQTGGFGIGAKTPFCYTSTFTIRTVTDDSGARHERVYVAHKDDGGFAKMSLVTTRVVDANEPTGTTISFAVAPNDWKDFEYAVGNVCRFWNPRPQIIGTQDEWKWIEDDVIHQSKNWTLASGRNAFVIIDGIPYTLRLAQVYKDDVDSDDYEILANSAIRLTFETGEIDVSATREDLDYKPRTVEAIKARVKKCLEELREKVSSEVASAKNLWEASLQWKKSSRDYRKFLVQPEWNGIKLHTSDIAANTFDFCSHKKTEEAYLRFYKKKHGKLPKKTHRGKFYASVAMTDYIKITQYEQNGDSINSIKHRYSNSVDRSIPLRENVIIIEDDEGKARPNRLRLQTLFEQNPDTHCIAVVQFKEKDELLDAYLKYIWGWDHIPKRLLTSIPKAKNARKGSKSGYTINAVKRLKPKKHSHWGTMEWVGDTSRAPEDDKGGLYVIIKNGKALLKDDETISKNALEELEELLEKPIYGILYKYRNKISDDWEKLLDAGLVAAKALEIHKETQNFCKLGYNQVSNVFGHELLKNLKKSKIPIEDKDIVDLFANMNLADVGSKRFHRLSSILRNLNRGGEIPKIGTTLNDQAEAIAAKYPLMTVGYYRGTTKRIYDELIFYINARVKEMNNDADN